MQKHLETDLAQFVVGQGFMEIDPQLEQKDLEMKLKIAMQKERPLSCRITKLLYRAAKARCPPRVTDDTLLTEIKISPRSYTNASLSFDDNTGLFDTGSDTLSGVSPTRYS